EKRETTKIELLLKGQQRRMVKKRATPKCSRLSHLIYVPKYFLGMLSDHGRNEARDKRPTSCLPVGRTLKPCVSPQPCAVSVAQLVSAFGCSPKGWWLKLTQGRDPPFLREVFQPTTCFRMLS